MPKTFHIRNWKKFQHFTKAKPPWIKLYREIKVDPNWIELRDASKGHLVSIMLLASEMGNSMPFDTRRIKKLINANQSVNLQELMNKGWIVIDDKEATQTIADDDTKATPLDRDRDREDREIEKETTTDCVVFSASFFLSQEEKDELSKLPDLKDRLLYTELMKPQDSGRYLMKLRKEDDFRKHPIVRKHYAQAKERKEGDKRHREAREAKGREEQEALDDISRSKALDAEFDALDDKSEVLRRAEKIREELQKETGGPKIPNTAAIRRAMEERDATAPKKS